MKMQVVERFEKEKMKGERMKIEVLASIKETQQVYSYKIASFDEIFSVVRGDLTQHIDYDAWERILLLSKIIIDGEEIDLGLIAKDSIFEEVYTQKLVDAVKEILEYEPEKDESWERRDKARFLWGEDDGKPLYSAEQKGGREYVEKLKKFLENPYPMECVATLFKDEDLRHVLPLEDKAIRECEQILKENEKRIWERMKSGKKVELVFDWEYS